jgi:hypothetical protein
MMIETIKREGPENLQFDEDEVDEFVQMMLRFNKACLEGAAKESLRFVSQVIFGLKRNRTFEFDKFQLCTNVLEALTRDEIPFIGRMYKFLTDKRQEG